MAYHYIEDSEFRKHLRRTCSSIVNQLVQKINCAPECLMTVEAHLIGSGAKNLITQDAERPIDLDYNLCIKKERLGEGREIREYVRKQFNRVLKANGWGGLQGLHLSAYHRDATVF